MTDNAAETGPGEPVGYGAALGNYRTSSPSWNPRMSTWIVWLHVSNGPAP